MKRLKESYKKGGKEEAQIKRIRKPSNDHSNKSVKTNHRRGLNS